MMTKKEVKNMELQWTWLMLNGWMKEDFSDERMINNASMVVLMLASEYGRGVKTSPDGLYQ